MKKIIFSMIMALPVLLLGSCEKESEGLTRITYYPVLTLDGDETVIVNKGGSFVEPGFSAILNGEDVSSEVVVKDNIDSSTSGVYSVNYKITNSDGFSSTASRTIIVLDATDPVEGIYVTDSKSYRDYNGNKVEYGKEFVFLVFNRGSYYEFSDLFAGWYEQRAGYGAAYAMTAEVTLADDGTMTLVDSFLEGWGDSANGLGAGSKYDFTNHKFTYSVGYSEDPEMFFYITATKK